MEIAFGLLFLLSLFLTLSCKYLKDSPPHQSQESLQEAELKAKIAQMKIDADALNSPSTFAQYSKLSRAIIKEEQNLKQMKSTPVTEPSSPSLQRQLAQTIFKHYGPYAATLALIGSYASISKEYYECLWPLSTVMGSITGDYFSVSLAVWYAMCCSVAGQLLGLVGLV